MSLCISVVTPEGIVVSGESRQTQVIGGVNRVGSDSAIKVFQLTDTVLAATAGWAYLQPQGATLRRNISSLVEDFKPTIVPNSTVRDIATALHAYFNTAYQQHIAQLPQDALPAGHKALDFIVAGYNPNSRVGEVYGLEIPTGPAPTNPNRATNNPGPWWIGQCDVVARIINGYDPILLSHPLLQGTHQPVANMQQQLAGLGYAVFYNTMTLQDAIDFSVGLIKVTITIQKFTAGTGMQPGSVAGVGGPIDVAVVKPGGTVTWISQKQLHS